MTTLNKLMILLLISVTITGCSSIKKFALDNGFMAAKLCSGEQGWQEVRMAIRRGASLLKWDTSNACYYLGFDGKKLEE